MLNVKKFPLDIGVNGEMKFIQGLVVYGHGQSHICGGGATGSDVTGPGNDRMTPKGVPLVRVCATGSCAISALVEPFHR